jgi:hypothetical protein
MQVDKNFKENLLFYTITSTAKLQWVYTECPKSLEPMGILIIFLIFIYRLKLKAKKKKALTFEERVETVLLGGRQGWNQRQVADEFNARHPERMVLSIPIC